MAKKELPAHIAAALAGAGGAGDSAGQTWAGRDLSGEGNPLHQFDHDDGRTDPAYEAALQWLAAGTGGEAEVVAALANARVFVPIVATLGEEAEGSGGLTSDKQADMALVTLQAPDGRRALPAFSNTAALEAWHPEARPVAVYAPRAALAAVSEDAELMVMDPGAALTFVVRRPAVWALAKQHEWVPSYRDPGLLDWVAEATSAEEAVMAASVEPGTGIAVRAADGSVVAGGGHGPELRLVLQVRDGLGREELAGLAGRIQDRLQARQEFAERVDSLELKFTR